MAKVGSAAEPTRTGHQGNSDVACVMLDPGTKQVCYRWGRVGEWVAL